MFRDLGYHGGFPVFLVSLMVGQWAVIENTLMGEGKGDMEVHLMEVGMTAASGALMGRELIY